MDKKYAEKIRACEKIHEQARYLRGRFLNTVAVIEHDISATLTEYFCAKDESKRELFFSEIAISMPLNSKRELLIKILKADYPRYWNKNGQILMPLKEIQVFRNKLAHSVVDVSDEALCRPINEGIGFIQWKKGCPITEQEFEDWDAKANMILSALSDIKRLLHYKEHPIA